MTKYYKVIKPTFMWEQGAIISNGNDGVYRAIEDIWNKVTLGTEYISAHIIENKDNADFFERVYPSQTDKTIFLTKEVLKKAYESFIK